MIPDRYDTSRNDVLEFCALVRGKEEVPGGMAAYRILDEPDRVTLDTLLSDYAQKGATAELVRRGRVFLTTYRVIVGDSGVLSGAEKDQLNQILDPGQDEEQPRSHRTASPYKGQRLRLRLRPLIVISSALVIALIVVITLVIIGSGNTPPPSQPGTAQQNPLPVNVAPGSSDLQQLQQNYGPWKQLTPSTQFPQTGAPGLLLLSSGNYFVSEQWTIPSNLSGWQQDTGGNVSGVNVQSDYATVVDANGNQYVVRIGQPFIFAYNPEIIIQIADSTGTVLTINLADATAHRQHYK